jgi:YedE family putative selenium metabolism protein
MARLRELLISRLGPVIAGSVIGLIAPLLVKAGNPGNMGFCMVCFARDTAGALGLHRAAPVQYIRPELIGLVLGSLAASLAFREFRSRGGGAPIVRFALGVMAAIGGLIFLGCPWRAFLRLAGGDGNAVLGVLGLVAGVWVGTFFLRRGFSLGRSQSLSTAAGLIVPAAMAGLMALLLFAPLFGRNAQGDPVPPIFFSSEGPGSQHAPILLALAAGLLIGFLAQRSRFCTVGGIRDAILIRDFNLLNGVLFFALAAFLANLALGLFRPGFIGQPVAHTDGLWNFLGMSLSGLAYVLAGGCPGRQLTLAGEGDTDAGIFFFGLIAGTALVHDFNLASSAKGVSIFGPSATIAGLGLCILLGSLMREKRS